MRQNLTDELGRNSLDENGSPRQKTSKNIDVGDVDININNTPELDDSADATTLPPEIKGKLRKFAKYEAKYPLLLDAYKNEKARNEQVVKFEKILQENTPCSSIQEAEALVEYLNSLTLKNNMLTDELRKISKVNTDQQNAKVKELEDQIFELQTSLEKKDASNVAVKAAQPQNEDPKKTDAQIQELSSEVERLKEDNQKLEASILDNSEIEQLKKEKEELAEKLKDLAVKTESLEGKSKDESRDLTKLSQEKAQLFRELTSLKAQFENLSKDHEELQKAESSLRAQIVGNEGNINDADRVITDLKVKVNECESLLEEKSSEILNLRSELETANEVTKEKVEIEAVEPKIETPQVSSTKKNKKKKKKGGKGIPQPETSVKDTEQLPANESSDESANSLQGKYESLLKELESIKAKNVERENDTEHLVELQKDLDKVREDYGDLQKENEKAKRDLKVSYEEVESIRDMLKEVGDDLVTSRDEVKTTKQKYEELLKSTEQSQEVSGKASEDLLEKINTIESQKLELEVLRKQHSQAVTDYEKEKAENRILVKNAEDEKQKLEGKVSQLDKKILEIEKDFEAKLKLSNDGLDSLKKEKASFEEQIKSLQSEKAEYVTKINKFQEELRDVTRLKKSEASLKKELDSVQVALVHKDKTIGYFEKQVKDYEVSKNQLLDEINKLRSANKDLGAKISLLNEQRTKSNQEKFKLNETLRDLKIKLDESTEENKRLTDKVDVLQDKYSGLQEMKSTSNDQIESIKKQCEELSINSKEARQKVEQLEEELSESRAMLQERTREASTIRRLLLESEENQSSKIKELNSRVATLTDEKDRLQSENTIDLTRKQRELEEVQFKNQELEKIISGWESREESLVKEIKDLKNSTSKLELERRSSTSSSDELTGVITKLKDSLSVSERKIREFENLNNVLKKLNEELTMKLDRLTKNYKLVSSQLNSMKEKRKNSTSSNGSPLASPASTRSNSISNLNAISKHQQEQQHTSSPSSSPSANNNSNGSIEEKTAYVKNVLLGFLEHKDQRQQLLPVISMLLQLNKSDEKRLLLALK